MKIKSNLVDTIVKSIEKGVIIHFYTVSNKRNEYKDYREYIFDIKNNI